MADPRAQVLADEIKRRVAEIVKKEKSLAILEAELKQKDQRLRYREENLIRRERIIFGKKGD